MRSKDKLDRKSLFISLIFIILLVSLSNCEEEKREPRSYPRLNTLPVTNITENGATFRGEIYSEGTEKITEHGFIWDAFSDPRYSTSNKVILGPAEGAGEFSSEILTTLAEGRKYLVKAFAKTDEHIVYGPEVIFKSLGSGAPKVTGFEPSSGRWGDTITIKGENFSYVPGGNIVLFNDKRCTTVETTDTTLAVIISPQLSVEKSRISVGIEGNVSVFEGQEFQLILPSFSDMSQSQAFWGDTITITFNNLNAGSVQISANIGSLPLTITEKKNNTFRFLVTDHLAAEINTVTVKINNLTLNLPDPLVLEPPVINSIVPLEGTWGIMVALEGKFNKLAARSSVTVGSAAANILSVTRNKLILKIPNTLRNISSGITYSAQPFTVSSADKFTLKPPQIKSFAPLTGTCGTEVTIKGKYFGVSTPEVKFGGSPAVVTSYNDSTIIVKAPGAGNGPFKISVTQLETATSTADFILSSPSITSFYPLTGTFNDEITIEGNFSVGSAVYFDYTPSEIINSENGRFIVRVPPTMDSIPRTIKIISLDCIISSTEKFILAPPQIISVSPETLIPGHNITINGINFNPATNLNKVEWDIYSFPIISASNTQIVARCPDALPIGEYKIKVTTGGYTRASSQNILSSSPWLRIASPEMSTNMFEGTTYPAMTIYGESIGGHGYLCSPASNLMYKFDPSDNSWTQIYSSAPFPFLGTEKMAEAVVKDTFYLIAGQDYITGAFKHTYAFDEKLNDWKDINNTSTVREGIAFSLNDKVYFGFDYRYDHYKDLHVFNPAINYTWKLLIDLPYSITAPYTTYFSLKNKGYVLFSNNDLFEYDPVLNKWTKKNKFPGQARRLAISFCLGDNAYMGTGLAGSTLLNDLWKYDPFTDTWTSAALIPGPRHSAVALTLNNKAYVGYGVAGTTQLTDFYEFDPD